MTVVSTALVGQELEKRSVSWDERDTMLYALGIGAGQTDPSQELEFTTENTLGAEPKVFPTFGAVQGARVGIRKLIEIIGPEADLAKMLHAQQTYEQSAPLPVKGAVNAESHISEIWDKRTATLVVFVTELTDPETGELFGRSRQSLFFRDLGGWGGERGPSPEPAAVSGPPSHQLEVQTRRDQPLLYRLSGDNNPLHSDPAIARRGGFDRPIMHGMCIYGIVGRTLLHEYAASDPARFSSLTARFSRSVYPGEPLKISAWERDSGVDFVVTDAQDNVVLRDGRFTLA